MSKKCESCGMAIEAGHYCAHCVDEHGNLQNFELRFERMLNWQLRRGSDKKQAEKDTIAYMATMPAWANHPEVKARCKA